MKKGNGNRYFSIKLQKLEADITFSVVEELMKRGILCLTVHDSIRVQAEYVGLVEELYNRECYKRVGSYPSLKTEHPEVPEYVYF